MLREHTPRDAKEHQGCSQAFERERDYPGSGDPQTKADHKRCDDWVSALSADSLLSTRGSFQTRLSSRSGGASQEPQNSGSAYRHAPGQLAFQSRFLSGTPEST
jgi:hypothetical protein